jgi:hypothetical protein
MEDEKASTLIWADSAGFISDAVAVFRLKKEVGEKVQRGPPTCTIGTAARVEGNGLDVNRGGL